MIDLCESFRKLSSWTSLKLRTSLKLGLAFNEETITESILLKLAERHAPQHLAIKSWTKPEEGKGTKATAGKPIGADWDFWFSDHAGKGFYLRVQAKRQFKSGRYESLDGTGQQIVDLWNNRGRAVPIYVFYNDTDGPHFAKSTTKFNANRFQRMSMWGCSFAPLTAIPRKPEPTPDDISEMRPWHCLVCSCEAGQRAAGTLPETIRTAVQAVYHATMDQGDNRLAGIENLAFEITSEQPEWVELLEDETFDRPPDDLRFEERLGALLDERKLQGVTLIKELQPEKSKNP